MQDIIASESPAAPAKKNNNRQKELAFHAFNMPNFIVKGNKES